MHPQTRELKMLRLCWVVMTPANVRPSQLCFRIIEVGVSLHYAYHLFRPSQCTEFFCFSWLFREVVFMKKKMRHSTNKQVRDLFCKGSPGAIDLIRTQGKVGASVSVGDRVSRPVHETGFARLVDQTKIKACGKCSSGFCIIMAWQTPADWEKPMKTDDTRISQYQNQISLGLQVGHMR